MPGCAGPVHVPGRTALGGRGRALARPPSTGGRAGTCRWPCRTA